MSPPPSGRQVLRDRYGWHLEPHDYSMPRLEQTRELLRRGASEVEIAVLFGVCQSTVHQYVVKLNGHRPAASASPRTARLKERLRARYEGRLPDAIIAAQVHWDFDAWVASAHDRGATYAEIGAILGVSRSTVQLRCGAHKRRLWMGQPPVERWFEEQLDLQQLAHGPRRPRRRLDLSKIPTDILLAEIEAFLAEVNRRITEAVASGV